MTFREGSSILHYRSNGRIKQSLSSVSLSFRTRQNAATLLHAQKGSEYLTISVQDSYVVMELQTFKSTKTTVQSQGPINDGEWHTVELGMENLLIPNSRWVMVVDGDKEELSKSETATGNLDFLKRGADIFLGGLSLDAGVSMSGCLGTVEIGELPLPFHLDTELNLPRPQEEQFARVNTNAVPHYGCWGSNVCLPNPCTNEGECEDIFDLHHCKCPSEWTGPLCQDPTDACISSPCLYGNCTNLQGAFKCVCELGYSGDLCETEVDMCEDSSCNEGATCIKGLTSYACLCPQNMTGQYCE